MHNTLITSPTMGIHNLPEEVMRHIFSYLTEEEILWRIGLTCKTFMEYSIRSVKTIEMPRLLDKQMLALLEHVLRQEELSDWIRHVIILGDRSKNLLEQGRNEIKGSGNADGTFILRGVASIAKECISHLAKYCSGIETFVMLGCNQFTNSGLNYLTKNSPEINTLCIRSGSFGDGGLKSVVKNLQKLKYLNLKNCDSLTDKGMQYIGHNSYNLKELDVENCNKITNSGIRSIAQNCRAIERINIAGCWEITDDAISDIATGLRTLKYLNISKCERLTDLALQHIFQSSKYLETLVINEIPINVTSKGLCRLVQNLPDLQSLDMMYSSKQVDDNVVLTISKNSKAIKNLNLNFCDQLTDASLMPLGLQCLTLEVLSVFACYHFTSYCIMHLQQTRPNLRIDGYNSIF